ncbi:MAG: glycoside hydrolase family 2 protein, partial [Pseudomonadota bacterium]
IDAVPAVSVDLSTVAVSGENAIEIRFLSSVAEGAKRHAAQPFPVPHHARNSPIPHGNMLRKPQCDFGWDWNIALASVGAYGRMMIAPNAAPRLRDVRVTQAFQDEGVVVTATLVAERAVAENTSCVVEFAGRVQRTTLPAGAAEVSVTFVVTSPELWWPAGHGPQTLHPLVAHLGGSTLRRRVGLRQIELITDPDEAGARFGLRVNGREIFAKGANWIPADALPGRISREGVQCLLQSAVDANMNMIRVWGGGRYEPDFFYDLCDEMGLLVWQDFMFACNLYPSTPDFLAEVEAEVADVVSRLCHHACIALWCGDNELIGALTWFEESLNDRDRYLVSYDRLNRTLETTLKRVKPDANWWPSSPSPGVLSFGDAWHEDGAGDMHFWSVWHEGRDFEHYRDISPRFCSEFGFQSYPSMDVVRSFAEPRDFNIAAPVLESHQKNQGGNARIAETIFRYFRFPSAFDDFVYLSQVQQGLAIKTAVDHWRSLKPHCLGALYWQLNDTWPVASWSSLDYGGGWKLLHHMARRFFEPLTVVAVPQGEEVVLRGVNDTGETRDVCVKLAAVSLTGRTRPVARHIASVPIDRAVDLGTVRLDALQSDEILVWTWTGADGEPRSDHFAPQRYKQYDLPPPNVRMDVKRAKRTWTLTLEADALAFFVAVESSVPGRFSDNALLLRPGEPVTVSFAPRRAVDVVGFTLRDLHSATFTTP